MINIWPGLDILMILISIALSVRLTDLNKWYYERLRAMTEIFQAGFECLDYIGLTLDYYAR